MLVKVQGSKRLALTPICDRHSLQFQRTCFATADPSRDFSLPVQQRLQEVWVPNELCPIPVGGMLLLCHAGLFEVQG